MKYGKCSVGITSVFLSVSHRCAGRERGGLTGRAAGEVNGSGEVQAGRVPARGASAIRQLASKAGSTTHTIWMDSNQKFYIYSQLRNASVFLTPKLGKHKTEYKCFLLKTLALQSTHKV